jgi:hypothetical protein
VNLNEIKELLSKRLKCPERHTKTIINMLDIVKHKGKRVRKMDMVEIIERDAKK